MLVVLGGGMLLTASLVFSTFHCLPCSISPWDPTPCYAGDNDDQVADDLDINKEFGEVLISGYFAGVVWLQSRPSHVPPSWSWWIRYWDYSLGWHCWSSIKTSGESYQAWKGEALGSTLPTGCESKLLLKMLEDPPPNYPSGVVPSHFVRGPTPKPTKLFFLQNGRASQILTKWYGTTSPLAWANFGQTFVYIVFGQKKSNFVEIWWAHFVEGKWLWCKWTPPKKRQALQNGRGQPHFSDP